MVIIMMKKKNNSFLWYHHKTFSPLPLLSISKQFQIQVLSKRWNTLLSKLMNKEVGLLYD